jgi:hypothetical protein
LSEEKKITDPDPGDPKTYEYLPDPEYCFPRLHCCTLRPSLCPHPDKQHYTTEKKPVPELGHIGKLCSALAAYTLIFFLVFLHYVQAFQKLEMSTVAYPNGMERKKGLVYGTVD